MQHYETQLKPLARQLRSTLTDAEQLLWSRLRGKQLLGIQFYRQKPIGRYIVDFHAPKVGLVVEVDGGQHLEPNAARADAERTAFLERQGLAVLRFDNRQVLLETDAVLEVIFGFLERKIPPTPPFSKGGAEGRGNEPAPFSKKGAAGSRNGTSSETRRTRKPPFEKGAAQSAGDFSLAGKPNV